MTMAAVNRKTLNVLATGYKQDAIKIALDRCGGSVVDAAKMLGVSRVTIWRWKKRAKSAVGVGL